MRDIHTIAVGESGEYGRRLVRYLERHVPPSVRIYHFTRQDAMKEMKERADIYVIDPAFAGLISEKEGDGEGHDSTGGRACIYLTDEERGENSFSRTDPPKMLLGMMGLTEEGEDHWEGGSLRPCRITVLYSPAYEEDLMTLAMARMEEGDLYLGFEDLGPGNDSRANVGDLCYYIHLRDEDVLDIMEEMCDRSTGIFRLDSPDLFFCLKELTYEEYQWFFDRLRASRRFAGVYVGAGSGFLADPRSFNLFDRVVLIDSLERGRQHAVCARLRKALRSETIDYRGEIQDCNREEILKPSDIHLN